MFTQTLLLALLFLNPFFDLTTDNKPENKSNGILWQSNRKLTWNDFQSEIDNTEPLHAITSTNIDVKAQCYGNVMRFVVRCVFVTNESWSKNKISTKLLDHEQLHFDLTEVYARLLRQKLSQKNGICGSERGTLDKVVNKHFADWKKEQDRYDQESNHGLDAEKQKLWADKVAQQLSHLEAYAYTE